MSPRRLRLVLTLLVAGVGGVLAALLLAAPADAAPARPGTLTLEQPGGESFQARLFGDEWYSGHETRDGYTILEDANGRWRYAEKLPDGSLHASSRLVGGSKPTVAPHLRDSVAVATADRRRDAVARRDDVRLSRGVGGDGAQRLASLGSDKSLVILAQFQDQASLGSTPSDWATAFFGAGKSVAGYYSTASGGQFTLAPAAETSGTANDGVVGWVTLPMNHPDQTSINDLNRQATRAAVLAADPYVDFAAFDTNNDGVVRNTELHVTVIAAGMEASYGVHGAKYVWGHRWGLGGTVPPASVDGKSVGGWGYTQFGEYHSDHMAAMGIMVHEIGHDLGLPDLYDTDYGSYGVGRWSVMSYGSWGWAGADAYQGMTPPLPDAWSRSYKGWVTPTVVTGTQTRTINAATSGTTGVAVQLRDNPNGPHDWFLNGPTGTGEYFLVENRQQTSYDASLPGSGLLVWHIDESRSGNSVDSARLVDIEEADGLNQIGDTVADGNQGDPGDLYRGGGSTTFNTSSNPNSNLIDGTASGAAMTGVSASGPTMSATFTGPGGPVPPANDDFASATTISGTSGNTTGNNDNSTSEVGEPNHAGLSAGKSVWWKWTAPATGPVLLDTQGSSIDTLLGVYTGSAVDGLTEVAANDDNPTSGSWSQVEIDATAGTTYRIAIDTYLDGSTFTTGPVELSWRPAPTAPAAPTDVTALPGDGEATVSWTPGDDHGSVSDGFTVTSTPGNFTATVGSGSEATVTGLTNGTEYTFTVREGSDQGDSPESAPSNAVTPSTGPYVPGAPTGVSATAGAASAHVSWTAPATDGGSAVTGYTVTSTPGGVSETVAGDETSATMGGLTNGTAYTFRVRATNDVGDSPASAASNQVTPIATDLAVGLTLVDHPAETTFAYRATVSRTGGADATPVVVEVALPSTVAVGELPAGCTGTQEIFCDLGAVATGGSEQVDVTVTPLSAGPHAAVGSVDIGDATPGNDAVGAVASVDFVCDNAPTSGNDKASGTGGDDVLCGLAGNDKLAGKGGDDLMFGGLGKDTLVYTNAAAGMVVNLNAQDLTSATASEKTPGTGDGTDRASEFENVKGSDHNDILMGSYTGNDKLWGLGGKDRLLGYDGNDKLYGGDAADALFGGKDNDLLVGGAGKDTLNGGPQSDTCQEKSDKRVSCES